MARRHKTRTRKSGANIAAPLLLGAGGILLVLVVLLMFLQPDSKLCVTDDAQVGKTILLVDVSDKLRPSQQKRLENELNNISAQSTNRVSPYLSRGKG